MQTELLWDGKYDERGARRPVAVPPAALLVRERTGDANVAERNFLVHGDNAHAMAALLPRFRNCVRLIYIDPPFDSKRDFVAFTDRFGTGAKSYLHMLYERLYLMHQLLAQDASIFVHCDWRISHWVRCLLDEVFGAQHFRNHIVWVYGEGARGAKAVANQFARNHDDIWCYSKNGKAFFSGARGERRYTLREARRAGFRRDAEGRWFKTAPRGDYTDASIERLAAQGRVHHTKNGGVRIKYYLRAQDDVVIEDVALGDVWSDIPDRMHCKAQEQTGYPTQKPLALLRRIIESHTGAGDLVADFFCGSGTTLLAAHQLGRHWIGVDCGEAAITTARARLAGASFGLYTV